MRSSAIFALSLGCALALAHTVAASTYTVTTNTDSGAGSLRDAITLANANPGADSIVFAADYTIVLASVLPSITSDITITGNGWQQTVIDGGNPIGGSSGVRAFRVAGTGDLTLDGVMLTNCYSFDGGGAVTTASGGSFTFLNSWAQSNRAGYGGFVENWGATQIEGSVAVGNEAFAAFPGGGAIYSNAGSLSIRDSSMAENTVPDSNGGSISVLGGTLVAERALFEGSYCGDDGGALWIDSNAGVRIANSTFTGNTAGSEGGAIYVTDATTVVLANVTITENQAGLTNGGGGIGIGAGGIVSVKSSILSANSNRNCTGGIASLGYNIEDSDTCWFSGDATSLTFTDPMLGPYQAWDDGRTYYHPLLFGSPAVDGAGPGGCTWDHDLNAGTPEVALTADQRGEPRPVDGDADDVAVCDIGAIELNVLFADGFETGGTTRWSTTVD